MLDKTKTKKNLEKAMAEEALAHIQYKFFAKKAKDDGLDIVAKAFEDAATNEYEHCLLWFKELHGGEVPTTEENLQKSADDESMATTTTYSTMAVTASAEGMDELASKFMYVDGVEARHEFKFVTLLLNIKDGTAFSREQDVMWECELCGMQIYGPNAPEKCPLCGNDKGHYFITVKNY